MNTINSLIVFALLSVTLFLAYSIPRSHHLEPLAFAQGSTVQHLTDYENPIYRIKLQYPSNWIKLPSTQAHPESGLIEVLALRPPATNNLSSSSPIMIIQRYNGSTPFEQFMYHDLFGRLNSPQLHFHIISNNITDLSGAPASEFIFTYHSQTDHEVLKLYQKNGADIYTIAYNADSTKYDYYLPTVLKIIKSIQITK